MPLLPIIGTIAVLLIALVIFVRLIPVADYIIIGYFVWHFTWRTWEWHPAISIITILITLGIWHMANDAKIFGVYIFKILGSAGTAFATVLAVDWFFWDARNLLPGVAEQFDVIWKVVTGIIVFFITLSLRGGIGNLEIDSLLPKKEKQST